MKPLCMHVAEATCTVSNNFKCVTKYFSVACTGRFSIIQEVCVYKYAGVSVLHYHCPKLSGYF